MNSFKEHLLQYAKRELAITAFDQTELGDTVLKFLEQSADLTGNNTDSMQQLVTMLSLLIDQQPVAPITETDFEAETHTEGDRTVEILRCTRYPYLYKQHGRYYDDRAVAYRFADSAESDRMYLYQSGRNSKQEVELPYYPSKQVQVISRDQLVL